MAAENNAFNTLIRSLVRISRPVHCIMRPIAHGLCCRACACRLGARRWLNGSTAAKKVEEAGAAEGPLVWDRSDPGACWVPAAASVCARSRHVHAIEYGHAGEMGPFLSSLHPSLAILQATCTHAGPCIAHGCARTPAFAHICARMHNHDRWQAQSRSQRLWLRTACATLLWGTTNVTQSHRWLPSWSCAAS